MYKKKSEKTIDCIDNVSKLNSFESPNKPDCKYFS